MLSNPKNDELLNKIYFINGYQVGIKKLFEYMKSNFPDSKISYRYIKHWLSLQPVYQINQLQRQTKHIIPIRSNRKLSNIQIDLIDFSQNTAPNQYKYIMNIIDIHSRYLWLIPLKQKDSVLVLEAFRKWYNENNNDDHPFRVIQTDGGGEFVLLRDYLEELNIKHLQSTNPQSQSIVERANQTIRRILGKNVSLTGKSRFTILQNAADVYNNTYHSTLYMTPNEKYNLSDEDIKKDLHEENKIDSKNIFKKRLDKIPISNINKDLEADDWVRIKRLKKSSLDKTKGFNNWSQEIYVIVRKIRSRNAALLPRYKVKNINGNELSQGYYRDDLLKISKDTIITKSDIIVNKETDLVSKTKIVPVEPVKKEIIIRRGERVRKQVKKWIYKRSFHKCSKSKKANVVNLL